MAKPQEPRPTGQPESEVWNAISILEQILEAVPGDRASLEALARAYEQVGDRTRAKEYSIRLARLLLSHGEVAAAGSVVEQLTAHAGDDAAVKELAARIEELKAAPSPVAAASAAPAPPKQTAKPPADRPGSGISEEIALAWHLLQTDGITQEEYASIVQDLTEMSSSSNAGTVSVLHVLQARTFKNQEKIVVALAKECGTPVISLASFEVREEAVSLLPPAFVVRRGALPFEMIGRDLLVAVVNPRNNPLRRDIERQTGRRCHYFLTLASEFDAALDRLKEREKEKQKEKSQDQKT
jgi:hypothetical protein